MADQKWLITATHESAHALARLRFGWSFRSVKIWSDASGDVLGSVTYPADNNEDAFAIAIVCLAGPVAESRLTGIAIHDQPGSAEDLRMARAALAQIDLTPPLDEGAALPYVEALVDANWAVIREVARELVNRHELDYATVVRLAAAAA
jgi:hypothetical protein